MGQVRQAGDWILSAISSICSFASGILLVLLLQRLLSGFWREYKILTLFLIINLLSMVPPLVSYFKAGQFWAGANSTQLFWTLTFLSQAALFALVLETLNHVRRDLPQRSLFIRSLTIGAVLAAIGIVAVHYPNPLNRWLTLISRDFSFLTALINLFLWTLLLQLRKMKRDPLMMTVCAGMGIQCAGDAIGHSLRMIARSTTPLGNFIIPLTAVFALYIWYRGFLKAKVPSPSSALHLNSAAGN